MQDGGRRMSTTFKERHVSTLFSAPLFRPLIQVGVNTILEDTMTELRQFLALPPKTTNSDVLLEAFRVMSQGYRSEYFYKNLIANRYFVGKHKNENAVLINEFRIGEAVADCVIINGQGVVYEIKTEFDTPNKLERQIENYYKAFPYLYVVTHEKSVERYMQLIEPTSVGLLAVKEEGKISTVKLANLDSTHFDIRTMFNTLRQKEIADILQNWYGALPDVPNGILYETHLKMARAIPAIDFQSEMQRVLKKRTLRVDNRRLAAQALFPLQSLVIQLDPTPSQFESLVSWLSRVEE